MMKKYFAKLHQDALRTRDDISMWDMVRAWFHLTIWIGGAGMLGYTVLAYTFTEFLK